MKAALYFLQHFLIKTVFQVRLDELEVELFDNGALRTEEATNVPDISTFVPPNLETRLGQASGMPQRVQTVFHYLWHGWD